MDVVIVTSIVVAVASAVAGAIVSVWQWRRLSGTGSLAVPDGTPPADDADGSGPRAST